MILSSNLLNGKIVLITGCNRGIGRGIAKQFVLHGAIVYANARIEGSLNELIDEIPTELKNHLIPAYFDVNDGEAVKQVFLKINKVHKRLDCLVNNAGIMKDALIGMVTKQLMQDLFNTNVFAVMDLMQFAVKLMSKQNTGSIINISSLVGINGNPGQIAYSGTKGAVISITKTAAKELAPKNIRVNAIAPGVIETDLLSDVNPETMDAIKAKIGMKRVGTPDDIAGVAVFLASDLSIYVTGQVIGVDGSTLM